MSIDSHHDVEALSRIGKIVANCLKHMSDRLVVGMTTAELDLIGRKFLELHGARSAPELTYGFPGATCISVNEEIAHGIPGARQIKAGDLVNIDVSAEKEGYFADTGGSFAVAPVADATEKLCAATRRALAAAVKVARAGSPINVIGRAIEEEALRSGYTVIRNLGSHGVGRALHEAPEFIGGFYDRRDRRVLNDGDVITIEPFLSAGAHLVDETGDGWTMRTPKGQLAAQYEHTMLITRGDAVLFTIPD